MMMKKICHDMSPAIEKVFMEAFPENERRPMEWLRRLLKEEPAMHLCTYDDKAMLCYWQFAAFVYVEYLAVDKSLRGQGMGGRIIRQLAESVDVPVVLEVEPPVDELTKRRVAFYQRHGFQLLPYPYEQPSYGVAPGMPLRLMLCVRDEKMRVPSAEEMAAVIYERVYGVKSDKQACETCKNGE